MKITKAPNDNGWIFIQSLDGRVISDIKSGCSGHEAIGEALIVFHDWRARTPPPLPILGTTRAWRWMSAEQAFWQHLGSDYIPPKLSIGKIQEAPI